MRCGGWRVWTWSLTRPVSCTAHLLTGDSAAAPGLFRVDANTAPFESEDATPGARVCVRLRALLDRVGRACLPCAFWCASPFPVAALSFFFVRPPPSLGRPVRCGVFFLVCAPRCVPLPVSSGPGCLGPWRLVRPPPLSSFLSLFLPLPPPALFFSFLLLLFVFFMAVFFVFFTAALFVVFFLSLPCFSFFAGCAVRGRFVCLWLWGVQLALRSMLRCVFCLVVCGVLVLGWVLAPCCAACCCAWSCWAVFVVLCCRLLLCSLFFFFFSPRSCGGPCCFGLCGARPWCVLLCGVGLSRCSCAGFCCAVPFGAPPCRGASLGSVLCCLFCCGAWVASCPVRCCGVLLWSVCPWALCCVVLLCCLWSVCCRSLCCVSGRFFVAPLVWCCVSVPVSLLLVRCSLAPLVLAGVVCCCLLCSGVCCLAWLSSLVSWWLPVSCSGSAVPVWPCGSPPCGLVWCVLALRSPVLYSVLLCCRVVVCCRALLSVCVIACACCLFPAAAYYAECVLVCFPVVGRLAVAPCSPVLCPVLLCCRVLVSVCGLVCDCCRFLL